MKEYEISDYSIFNNAISTSDTFSNEIDSVSSVISECKSELNDSIFMGPICDNCQEILSTLSTDTDTFIQDISKVKLYLTNISNNYKQGDSSASSTITSNSGDSNMTSAVTMTSSTSSGSVPVSSTPVSTSSGTVDISKYSNNPSNGFTVTTGNTTFNLNNSDRDLLYSVVSAESDNSYDDALAVTSVILNRCEDSAWVNEFGTSPVAQVSAPNQFSVYSSGSYKKYSNGNAPDTVKQAVDDALAGVRNCDYLSFRSNGSTGYSSNMISSTGNRYK